MLPLPQLVVIEFEIVVALIGEASSSTAGRHRGHCIRIVLARWSDIMSRGTIDFHHTEVLALHLIEFHFAARHHRHAHAKGAVLHARVLLAQLECRWPAVVADDAFRHLRRSHCRGSGSVALWRRRWWCYNLWFGFGFWLWFWLYLWLWLKLRLIPLGLNIGQSLLLQLGGNLCNVVSIAAVGKVYRAVIRLISKRKAAEIFEVIFYF